MFYISTQNTENAKKKDGWAENGQKKKVSALDLKVLILHILILIMCLDISKNGVRFTFSPKIIVTMSISPPKKQNE